MSKNFPRAGLSGMSMTGKTAGTPVFMPPEQIVNFKYVKPVSGVFSMGETMCYLLTGVLPCEFQEKREICLKEMTSPFYIPALLRFVVKTLPGRLTAFRLNRIK